MAKVAVSTPTDAVAVDKDSILSDQVSALQELSVSNNEQQIPEQAPNPFQASALLTQQSTQRSKRKDASIDSIIDARSRQFLAIFSQQTKEATDNVKISFKQAFDSFVATVRGIVSGTADQFQSTQNSLTNSFTPLLATIPFAAGDYIKDLPGIKDYEKDQENYERDQKTDTGKRYPIPQGENLSDRTPRKEDVTIIGNEKRVGGTLSWRNNNPGNLVYGDWAVKHGAIGYVMGGPNRTHKFAVFPTLEAGEKARQELLFSGKTIYKNDTLRQAMHRYAPSSENDTTGYIASLAKAANVSPDTPLREFTPEQQAKVLSQMRVVEGWKQGRVESINDSQKMAQTTPVQQSTEQASLSKTDATPTAPDSIQPKQTATTSSVPQPNLMTDSVIDNTSLRNDKPAIQANKPEQQAAINVPKTVQETPIAKQITDKPTAERVTPQQSTLTRDAVPEPQTPSQDKTNVELELQQATPQDIVPFGDVEILPNDTEDLGKVVATKTEQVGLGQIQPSYSRQTKQPIVIVNNVNNKPQSQPQQEYINKVDYRDVNDYRQRLVSLV